MPRRTLRNVYLQQYVTFILLRDVLLDSDSDTSSDESSNNSSQESDSDMDDEEDEEEDLELDLTILQAIRTTRYLNGHERRLPTSGHLHLAWQYSQNLEDHMRFMRMLRVSPVVFDFIVACIKDHDIFRSRSNFPQAPVEIQLAVTLYRMGRYGNGASVEDIRHSCGIGTGTVDLYTERCFTALESVHDTFVRALTPAEKEVEKAWIDERLGFSGSLWREGYVMYDGTIVVLYAKPSWNGDTYYTRKSNHGLNVQVCLPK